MKKIVIIYGHERPQESVANKKILETVADSLPQAEVVALAEEYPDWKFDVAKEQRRLQDADVIVFEYPVNWYSCPALMHKYIEDVFTRGFAYGSDDPKLKGKKFIASFTLGAPQHNYDPGVSGETTDMIAQPLKSTCWLCNIDYVGEVATTGAMYYGKTPEEKEEVDIMMTAHGKRLIDMIKSQI